MSQKPIISTIPVIDDRDPEYLDTDETYQKPYEVGRYWVNSKTLDCFMLCEDEVKGLGWIKIDPLITSTICSECHVRFLKSTRLEEITFFLDHYLRDNRKYNYFYLWVKEGKNIPEIADEMKVTRNFVKQMHIRLKRHLLYIFSLLYGIKYLSQEEFREILGLYLTKK